MTRRRTHRRAGGRYGPLPPPSIYDDTLPCGCVIDRNGDDLFVCADHRPRRPIPFYEPPGGDMNETTGSPPSAAAPPARCGATSLQGNVCERDPGHDGAHIDGFDTGNLYAWGWLP